MFLSVNRVDEISRLITLVIIFVFVLAITYFTTKFIANYQKGKTKDSNIQLLDAVRLSQNKYIQLVKIGKEYVALAICKDTVTVITKVPEEDLHFSQGDSAVGFYSILEQAKEKISNKKQGMQDEVESLDEKNN